jgi:hypothetical protein
MAAEYQQRAARLGSGELPDIDEQLPERPNL